MICALVLLAALGLAEASTLAEMVSNYAKVSTNTGLTAPNKTDGYTPRPIIAEAFNETDYDDFDDLEADVSDRQQPIETGNMMKYVNGLVSLLTLMYTFGNERRASVGEARYVPDAATKKFRHQSDPERDPISNYPPYNPLSANAAESYSQNDGKTSFDADNDQFKTGMNDYGTGMGQQDWNAIGHDYYESWQKMKESKKPWEQIRDEHPSFVAQPPPDYHEYAIHEDEHHHYHHEMDEDRESKRPYSYYFLGRKLWYIPLIFSVYFIIYIAALVLKSIARHKIQFPDKLWDLKDEHYKHRRYRQVDEITEKYEKAVDNIKYKLM